MKRVHRRAAETQRKPKEDCVNWGGLAFSGLGRRDGRERRGGPSSRVSRQVADLFLSLRLRGSAGADLSPQRRRGAEKKQENLCHLGMPRLLRLGSQRWQRAQRGAVLAPPRRRGEHWFTAERTPTGVPRRRVKAKTRWSDRISGHAGVRSPSALSASSATQAGEGAASPSDKGSLCSLRLCVSAVNKETRRRRVETKTMWSDRISGHAGVRSPSALSAISATQAEEGAASPSDKGSLGSLRLCVSAVNKALTCP